MSPSTCNAYVEEAAIKINNAKGPKGPLSCWAQVSRPGARWFICCISAFRHMGFMGNHKMEDRVIKKEVM